MHLVHRIPVPGTRRQQDSILCTSPPHPIGRVAVTLLDSQDKYRNPTILFHFEPICVIRSVTPSHGPVAGGTRLVVNVNVQSSQPMVYIGAHRLTGQGINASVVECKTPRSGPGAVTVRIGFVLGVICSGSVPFFYEEEPTSPCRPALWPSAWRHHRAISFERTWLQPFVASVLLWRDIVLGTANGHFP